jgi:hypothetical protein
MIPATRDQLITYALRQLGAPVIAINVAQEQLEDRVDEGLLFYLNYSKEGSVEKLYKHVITASTMTLSGVTGTFVKGEYVKGNTSGKKAKVYTVPSGTTLTTVYETTALTPTETIVGQTSGATATFVSIVLGDIDNQYVSIDPSILSIMQLMPLGTNTNSLFDVRYQMAVSFLSDLANMDLVDYDLKMRHITLINDLFNAVPMMDYSRISNQLGIKWNWKTQVVPGNYLVMRVLTKLDPATWPKVYSDEFLIELTTQLIKRQWGNNLKKFRNVQLLNGVVLDGDKIFEEADAAIKELKEYARKSFQLPTPFFCG